MKRPTGVTIIVVFHFLVAVLFAVLGIGLIAGATYVVSLINRTGNRAGFSPAALEEISGIGVAFILAALLPALLGLGLWKLKNWVRIVVIVLSALEVGSIVRGFFVEDMARKSTVSFSLTIFSLFANALVAWYLLRPEVSVAFHRSQPS